MHCPNFIKGKINLDQRILILFEELIVITLIYLPLILHCLIGTHLFQNVIYDSIIFSAIIIHFATVYGALIEPRIVKVIKINIDIKNLNENIRIVLFSDLHLGPYKKCPFANKIVSRVNKLKPDVILIAGDFITGDRKTFKYLKPLRNLKAKNSIIAVLGNHDYDLAFDFERPRYKLANDLEKMLNALNITVLRNSSKLIETKNGKINIVGLDELWAKRINVRKAFSITNSKHPTIVLSHNPDSINKIAREKVDIFLAGHTHGNTFHFPPNRPLFPFIRNIKLPSRYLKGFHKYKQIPIYVTSGLGEAATRMRFLGNFPEIIVFDLK